MQREPITIIETVESDDYAAMREDESNYTEAQRNAMAMMDDLTKSHDVGQLGIYKVSGGVNGSHALCETVPLDKYDPMSLEQYIADKYGAGDYRLMARIKGQKGVKGNKLISIAAPKEASTGLVPYQVKPDDIQSDLATMMRAISENQAATLQAILQSNQPKKSALDGLIDSVKEMDAEKLALVGGALGFVFKNFFQRPDPMKEIQTMLAITGDIRDLRGTEEKDKAPDYMQMLTSFAGVLGMAQKNAPAVATPAAPAVTSTPQPVAQEQGQRGAAFAEAFAPFIGQLLSMARDNADPDATATLVLSSVPENQRDAFYDFIDDENSLATMAGFEPAVLAHADWFSSLRWAILEQIEDSEGAQNDIPHDTASDGHADVDPNNSTEKQPSGDGAHVGADGQTNQESDE